MTLVAGNCHGRHSSLRSLSSRGRFLASVPGQVGVRPGTLSVVEADGELLESQEVSDETLQLRRQRQRHVAKVIDSPQLTLEVRWVKTCGFNSDSSRGT